MRYSFESREHTLQQQEDNPAGTLSPTDGPEGQREEQHICTQQRKKTTRFQRLTVSLIRKVNHEEEARNDPQFRVIHS